MEKEITIVRVFDAPRERVWKAWTDSSEVAQWWGPNGFTAPECEVDARVGGELSIVMLAGADLGPMSGMRAPMKGMFTEVIPNEKLVFTNFAIDDAGNHLLEGVTTVLFEDESGKTKLTVKASAKGMVPIAEQMLGGMEQGWSEQIDKLGAYVISVN